MKIRSLLYLLLVLLSTFYPTIAQTRLANASQTIGNYMSKAHKEDFNGLALVAQKGKVIFTKGYGLANQEKKIGFDKNSVFDIGSITKQFTGAAIVKLEMEGKLKTSDLLSKYIPNVPKNMQKITLHHLLTHSSGLKIGIGPDEELIDKNTFIRKVFKEPLGNTFGKFSYSNMGYSLLAIVIENISGMPYEKFMHKHIFEPAGMTQTGYTIPKWEAKNMVIGYRENKTWGTTNVMCHYDQGVTYHLLGNGGIMSTVIDMHKWYQSIKNNTILSKEATKKYIGKHIEASWGGYYGYGWATTTRQGKRELTSHGGSNDIFYCHMAYSLAEDFMSILIINDSKRPTKHTWQIDKILHGEFKAMEQKVIDQYTGNYRLPSGMQFSVRFNAQDQLIIPVNNTQLYHQFLGTPNDNPAIVKKYNKRSAEIMNLLAKSQYKAAAKLEKSYMPTRKEKVLLREEQRMFDRLKVNWGTLKYAEVLGSAARKKGSHYLTYTKFVYEKNTMYFYFYWKGNILIAREPIPNNLIKSFEPQKNGNFIAKRDQSEIKLTTKNGQPALAIGKKLIVTKK